MSPWITDDDVCLYSFPYSSAQEWIQRNEIIFATGYERETFNEHYWFDDVSPKEDDQFADWHRASVWRHIDANFEDLLERSTFDDCVARFDLANPQHSVECRVEQPFHRAWSSYAGQRTSAEVGTPLSTWLSHGKARFWS